MAEEQQDQQQDAGKIQRNFEATITRLSAILGKEVPKTNKRKVKKDAIADLVSNMFKKEQEQTILEVETELKSNLEKYVSMNKEFDEKEKEIKKLKETKMKEFTESCQKLFNKIEDLPGIEAAYVAALGTAAKG